MDPTRQVSTTPSTSRKRRRPQRETRGGRIFTNPQPEAAQTPFSRVKLIGISMRVSTRRRFFMPGLNLHRSIASAAAFPNSAVSPHDLDVGHLPVAVDDEPQHGHTFDPVAPHLGGIARCDAIGRDRFLIEILKRNETALRAFGAAETGFFGTSQRRLPLIGATPFGFRSPVIVTNPGIKD
jgi:hypothetical protein